MLKKILNILTKREKRQLFLLLVLMLLMALFQAIGVVSVLPFISLVMNPDLVSQNNWLQFFYQYFNFKDTRSFIIAAGLIMLFLILFGNLISAVATWAKFKFVWNNNNNISVRLLRHYLLQPYMFFLNRNSSELAKNILNEVQTLTNGYLIPVLDLTSRLLIIIVILIMVLIVNPLITVIAFSILGGSYYLIYWLIRKRLTHRGSRRLWANRDRFKIVGEAFGGIKEVKASGREQYYLESYSQASTKLSSLMAWNALVGNIPKYVLESVAFGSVIALILILLAIRGEAQNIIPLVSFFAFAGYRLMPAIQDVFQTSTQLKFNQATLDYIYEEMTNIKMREVKQEENFTDVTPLQFTDKIKLQNITFTYPASEEKVLEDITLVIKKNQKVGIVGATGAGKTTLIDILLGLFIPDQGQMTVDGIILDSSNVRGWQKILGYVPQQIYLSDDTVTNNIAFGIPADQIDINQVKKAASIARLDDFISRLPNGYDTVVGERGVRLSGGQMQRVGIARAVYHDPQVLILDEATSALDNITEKEFMEALEAAAEVKTLVIIAHRFNTVRNCDIIIMLENGKMEAAGNYEELMQNNDKFRALATVRKKD
ncbi:MAG TPA: ABC transporter ATP-binding protein [Syntrophomonadaceae bacterium]|nr:ABC transporter ATP-binding protein [Syntrophomonadaceae bacterium]